MGQSAGVIVPLLSEVGQSAGVIVPLLSKVGQSAGDIVPLLSLIRHGDTVPGAVVQVLSKTSDPPRAKMELPHRQCVRVWRVGVGVGA